MDLGNLIRTDIFYKNSKGDYNLGPNYEFIENDLNKIVDDLQVQLEAYMQDLSKIRPSLSQYDMHINYHALRQALYKFTRDIFGPRRFKAVLNKVPNYKHTHNYMKKFGLKMNSEDPNLHRRAAYFFYWFSVCKPFNLEKSEDAQSSDIPSAKMPEKHNYIIEYFNEYITYVLVQMILSSCIITIEKCPKAECENRKAGLKNGDCLLTIDLHQNENMFETFLSRLHYNKLNRSSLELFLSDSYIHSMCKTGKKICPLKKGGFYKWKTFD